MSSGSAENSFRDRFRLAGADRAVADRWGWIAAKALAAKSLLPVIGGLLTATTMQHNLTLVTRNAQDVAVTGSHDSTSAQHEQKLVLPSISSVSFKTENSIPTKTAIHDVKRTITGGGTGSVPSPTMLTYRE